MSPGSAFLPPLRCVDNPTDLPLFTGVVCCAIQKIHQSGASCDHGGERTQQSCLDDGGRVKHQ